MATQRNRDTHYAEADAVIKRTAKPHEPQLRAVCNDVVGHGNGQAGLAGSFGAIFSNARMARLIHLPRDGAAHNRAPKQEQPAGTAQSMRVSIPATEFDETIASGAAPGFRPVRHNVREEPQTDIAEAYKDQALPYGDLADSAPPAHMRYRPLPDPPDRVPPRPETREANGFIPAGKAELRDLPAASIGDLLERMRYEAQKDGTVLYLVDESPAFKDHGDQLLMVPSADKSERAILAALLLAKEKYGGAFEITGDAAFKRRAIDIMQKYNLDARLKNPEQDAMRRQLKKTVAASAFPPASTDAPVKPVPMHVLGHGQAGTENRSATTAPAASTARHEALNGHSATRDPTRSARLPDRLGNAAAQATGRQASYQEAGKPISMEEWQQLAEQVSGFDAGPPINRLAGKIVDHGAAPYDHCIENSVSYYVTLENEDGHLRTTWGVDLERAIEQTGVVAGDHVVMQKVGRTPVTFSEEVRDNRGNVTGTRSRLGHKILWEVDAPARRQKNAQAARKQVDNPRQGATPPVHNVIPSQNNSAEKPRAALPAGPSMQQANRSGKQSSNGGTPNEPPRRRPRPRP